jgi:hypothetical protein
MTTLENMENMVETSNGMGALGTTLNECVNLFFQIGAMRGKSKKALLHLFSKAYNENPLVATKVLFWVRDIRGGAGERQIFKDILTYLAENNTDVVKKNLSLIPDFGRWDDVLVLVGTSLEGEVFEMIKTAIQNEDGLCAKWLPRKGKVANAIRNYLKVSPKVYRKTIVGLTNVVETAMCAKDYSNVDYSKLPSLASARYQRAFQTNDGERYKQYKEALKNGETKINAGAVYPYDIVKTLGMSGDNTIANEQWNSLPNWMEGSNERVLPVVDVSGSMDVEVGGNPNLTCMDVAISLGLYISERNEGNYKDAFITFSDDPQLQILDGSLEERFQQLSNADWGMSTNLEKVYSLILNNAKANNIPQDMMPTKLLILSDMQFDTATNSRWRDGDKWTPTSQQMVEKMYEESGYELPQIIYWNLNASMSNFPVEFDKMGTALISGLNPSILKSILGGENLTPESVMMKTIDAERYNVISV